MKRLTTILGVVLLLIGAIWILQGFNILPGSFMTGHLEWAGWGGLSAAIGLGLVARGRRRR